MDTSIDPLRKKLADFIDCTTYDDFSEKVVRHAKLCILDLIGVSIVGGCQKISSFAVDLFTTAAGYEEATVWGQDRKVPVLAAALVNAVQGHAIDMDDGHRFANGHPGVVTIPAAIAIAEKEDLTGRELIEAVVLGYEIFIRLGTAANPDLLLRGFHTTATVGAFASASVAAKLLKLNHEQTKNALSLAGLQSAGLLEALTSGEAGKSFQVGKSSQSGVLAALMAQKGADGPVEIFEGDKGFFKVFAGKDCYIQEICKDFGKHYQIINVYCKLHAACRHIHSALDATAEILSRHKFAVEEVVSVDIETYSIAHKLTGHLALKGSAIEAKFSTPIAVALLLVLGRSDFSAYDPKFVSDPRVRSMAEKVRVYVNPQRDDDYPKQRSARVTITTQKQSYEHEMVIPKGEPESPLSEAEFIRKYEQNSLIRYPKSQVAKIKDTILDLENLKVRELVKLLQMTP